MVPMLRELLTKQGIKKLLGRLRIGGRTPASILKENRSNTKAALKRNFRDSVMADVDSATFAQSLGQVVKSRKRQTLSTLRNIMSSVRGEARAVLAAGRKGAWHNVSVLDGNTTQICIEHVGQSWRLPYSQIPNKPPRVPPVHDCRSFLRFVEDGEQFRAEAPFITQFKDDEELQREMLGPTRFEAFRRGELKINTYGQFEKATLNTLEDLGIE